MSGGYEDRDAHVKEKEEVQRSVEELKQWLSAKEAECQGFGSGMLMEKKRCSEVLKN